MFTIIDIEKVNLWYNISQNKMTKVTYFANKLTF